MRQLINACQSDAPISCQLMVAAGAAPFRSSTASSLVNVFPLESLERLYCRFTLTSITSKPEPLCAMYSGVLHQLPSAMYSSLLHLYMKYYEVWHVPFDNFNRWNSHSTVPFDISIRLRRGLWPHAKQILFHCEDVCLVFTQRRIARSRLISSKGLVPLISLISGRGGRRCLFPCGIVVLLH